MLISEARMQGLNLHTNMFYFIQSQILLSCIKSYLFLSQTSPGFYMSGVQVFFFKFCGKKRNCSLRAISPFPSVFSPIWRSVCYFHQIWNCRLQTLSVWKRVKLGEFSPRTISGQRWSVHTIQKYFLYLPSINPSLAHCIRPSLFSTTHLITTVCPLITSLSCGLSKNCCNPFTVRK